MTIKEARKKVNKSQEACARHLGISLGGYRKKEQNPSMFRIDEFARLADFLGYQFDFFYNIMCNQKTQNKSA